MARRAPLLVAPLLALGCASRPPPPPPPPSADLEAWTDAAEDHGPARSMTLPRAKKSIPEPPPPGASGERWASRTISERGAEPTRPRRRPLVDVSFQRSDMASAFQLLADAGGFNLVMAGGLAGQVSATLRRIDPFDALKAVAEANGVEVRYEGQVVVLKKR
jgi:hypothetical protein